MLDNVWCCLLLSFSWSYYWRFLSQLDLGLNMSGLSVGHTDDIVNDFTQLYSPFECVRYRSWIVESWFSSLLHSFARILTTLKDASPVALVSNQAPLTTYSLCVLTYSILHLHHHHPQYSHSFSSVCLEHHCTTVQRHLG